MQIVHIDKQIKMLDSPSIIVASSSSAVALALRSTTNFRPENAVDSVDIFLKHCSKQQVKPLCCSCIRSFLGVLGVLSNLSRTVDVYEQSKK